MLKKRILCYKSVQSLTSTKDSNSTKRIFCIYDNEEYLNDSAIEDTFKYISNRVPIEIRAEDKKSTILYNRVQYKGDKSVVLIGYMSALNNDDLSSSSITLNTYLAETSDLIEIRTTLSFDDGRPDEIINREMLKRSNNEDKRIVVTLMKIKYLLLEDPTFKSSIKVLEETNDKLVLSYTDRTGHKIKATVESIK